MKIEKLDLKLVLTEPQLGTVPKDPSVYATYIADKTTEAKKAEEVETVPEDVDKTEARGWTGFHSDEKGLFIYDYMILGFLKNSGNVLKDQLAIKNLRSKIDSYVFCFPRRIHFKRDGKNILKPDDVIERPLRAQTMQGPRVTLVRSDCVFAGAMLEFQLQVLDGPVSVKKIKEMLEYGKMKGLGQFRNGSYGRFVVV